MLATLRRHASSWLIKVAFGLIILSFLFFFGYTSLTKNSGSSGVGDAVALVNDEPIFRAQFEALFEAQRERFNKASSDDKNAGEFPKELESLLKKSLLNDMIRQKLLSQLAKNLNLTVSEKEVAEEITKMPVLVRDGRFDEIFYKEVFRPYYQRKYGADFEKELTDEIYRKKLQEKLDQESRVTEGEVKTAYDFENTRFSFQKIQTQERETADLLLRQWQVGGNLDPILKEKKLKIEEIPVTPFARLTQALPPFLPEEKMAEVAALTPAAPFVREPLGDEENGWFVFKLRKKETPSPKDFEAKKESLKKNLMERRSQDLLNLLLSEFEEKAQIKPLI
ncbi:MAG: SurA N-terminal domain-containing protein [Deltaproteobacteria bacterium]|nr:SurA N-terminal domain-containing protein [Deltaproteobacteria bacterium]